MIQCTWCAWILLCATSSGAHLITNVKVPRRGMPPRSSPISWVCSCTNLNGLQVGMDSRLDRLQNYVYIYAFSFFNFIKPLNKWAMVQGVRVIWWAWGFLERGRAHQDLSTPPTSPFPKPNPHVGPTTRCAWYLHDKGLYMNFVRGKALSPFCDPLGCRLIIGECVTERSHCRHNFGKISSHSYHQNH